MNVDGSCGLLKGRAPIPLEQFFQLIGLERAARIEVVTMDMSAAYIKGVTEHARNAEIVFDRFHVVRLLLDAVDEVRREQQRALEDTGDRKVLKKSRFSLLKNPWNLTRKEKQKLAAIQVNNRPLYRAYLLKESFQSIYDARTVEEADVRFNEWYGWARRSRLLPFVSLAETLRLHCLGIRRFIDLRLTNAAVEGYNSKIRMISHREAEDMYTKLLAFTNKLLVDAEKEDVLDLDSTLFERFGEQEGVAKGYHGASARRLSGLCCARRFWLLLSGLPAGFRTTLRRRTTSSRSSRTSTTLS